MINRNNPRPGEYYDPKTNHWYQSTYKGSPLRDLSQAIENGVIRDWYLALKPNKIDRIFFTGLYFLTRIPWYLLKFVFKLSVKLGLKLIKFVISTLKRQSSEIHYHNPNVHRYYRR